MRRTRRERWQLYVCVTLGLVLAHVTSQTNHSASKVNTTTEASTEATLLQESTSSAPTTHHPHPTWRPRRENCTPPAIEQFPRTLMGPFARKHGGVIIHLLVAIYTFLGLAIVCDEYFVASLDRICEELKLTPDVAGATFMAAGSSAPELATVVIGVFFAKDDIGISGVIGSAVFNIMFVISVCALCAGTVCYLNWWPLVRDCFFYSVAILVMLCTIFDEIITWGESLFMLCLYVVYCITLHYNPRLEVWAQTTPLAAYCKRQSPEEQTGLVTYRNLAEDRNRRSSYTSPLEEKSINFAEPSLESAWDTDGQPPPTRPPAPVQAVPAPAPVPAPAAAPGGDYYKPKETDAAEEVSPLVLPVNATVWTKITWGVTVPIHAACRATIPNCKLDKWKHWYPFTFVVSMMWISFYSYLMVWMITVIGTTLGIPDTVMGLTFVAAGVSVPDALSSLAVVKEGYGDMAVSNAVGSNVFDILICLGLPWFIQTAIIQPGSHVNVYSKGLTYSTLSLLSTVIFLLVATHLNGWKLDKKYGVILMVWYLLFISFAALYELNVFGDMNPEQCASQF